MHLCAFLSKQFSPAEHNYNVVNRMLLAVKWALEGWRHWLDGEPHPFVIWMVHKNLVSIQEARKMNAWNAGWGLFFNRFNFTLAYRPGSKNQKADALSHQHDVS